MADALDTIVNVTVTRETRTPSQRGFGIPMIVAYHEAWTSDRVRSYSSTPEMLDDGFTSTEWVYNMALAIESQEPSPSEWRVGRRATAPTQTIHLLPTITEVGYEHVITIDGATFGYTVQSGDGITDVVDGLVAGLSGATALGITWSDSSTFVTVSGATAGTYHTFEAKRGVDMLDATGASGLTADLNAIFEEDELNPAGLAYGYLIDTPSKAAVTILSNALEGRVALGCVQSADWDIKDAGQTGDMATALVNAAITRTAGIYHGKIGSHIAPAWMGKELPKNPGQSNWAHKTLATIPVDSLKSGERTAINAKKFSWYSRVGGTNITFEGATPAGEFLDIIHGIDFSTARIKEACFGALTANDKVPQTNAGIEVFRAAVYNVLSLCSSADFPIFDPATIVVGELTMDDVPTPDRANRILRGLTYQARLQGAFNRIVVRGRVYL